MATYEAVRELCSRLPDVPESIITHFLSKYGNTEVVFNKLKHGIPREDIDSYDPSLVSSPPLDHPTSYCHPAIGGYETNASFSPQAFRRITSHDPNLSGHECGSPGASHGYGYASGVIHKSMVGYPDHNLGYSQAPTVEEILTRQRKQLEQIHRMRDNYVQELSRLRASNDEKKVELSRLRMEVSEGPSHSDVGNIQDVIATLEYDIQVVKKKIHMEEIQVEMKNRRDIYTEEGPRWNCQYCKFLNHPLMTRCEFCDRPKR